jgi:hypothetical protein
LEPKEELKLALGVFELCPFFAAKKATAKEFVGVVIKEIWKEGM